ncbi:AraC family transcriptional regulator [Duganella sp. HH101]|uniref:AraC family transcriptional regulator n=1 Tax=Duganella sp. HH101 TaxID=1781066 RepID=UPI000874D409|nr:AraC family transcriptional regulator [Duganella sp. HH101]OFA04191.1 RCS-specific HTH-type transcriptional activator RclR [Duganella sp. HH101]
MNTALLSRQEQLDKLGRQISDIARIDGDHATAIPALTIYRRSTVTEPMPTVYTMGLGITIQGGKRVVQGGQVFDHGPGQALVASIDLPAAVHVTRAKAAAPYLGIRLDFELETITRFAEAANLSKPNRRATFRALSVLSLDLGVLDALGRLIQILAEPKLTASIAPLIQHEIFARLLLGPQGTALNHLIAAGTPARQIAHVIHWLKANYAESSPIDDLAAMVHMSPSTFREHFRAFAGISPLQYLKQLRLQSARLMMLNQGIDASNAAARVGYESPSQFSREYSRLFGAPPQRDIRRARSVGG